MSGYEALLEEDGYTIVLQTQTFTNIGFIPMQVRTNTYVYVIGVDEVIALHSLTILDLVLLLQTY